MSKLVSTVITTRNSGSTLEKLLQSLGGQTYRQLEIVVVDNNSTDNTLELAKKYTDKIFTKGPERSVQRNFGAKKSKGDYYLILDSDMELTKDVISQCVEAVETGEEKIGGVVIPEKSFGRGFWARTKAFEREINAGESYFDAARFFPKNVFWNFDGYDENLTGPEDWDLPQRISKSYKIAKIKAKILHNEGNPNLIKLAKRKYYYGLSVHKYLKKQKMSVVGPKTLYFLRIGFYKQWRKLIAHPLLTLGMFVMLGFETIGGGLGYIIGRFQK